MPHPREPDNPDFVKVTQYEKNSKGAPPKPYSFPLKFDPLIFDRQPEFRHLGISSPRNVRNSVKIFDRLFPQYIIYIQVK
jgi:hypothetical protein